MSIGFSEAGNYLAQTFIATGEHLQSLDIMMRSAGPGETKYHVLITTVKPGAEFQPDQILKEVNGVPEPLDADLDFHRVHIDLDGVTLVEGQTYAFIIDSFVTKDGVNDSSNLGLNVAYDGGFLSTFQPVGGTRADHFNADWFENLGSDLDFTAVFTHAGNTIIGTGKNNRIDDTHTPNGQPFASALDDTINGNGGKDRLFGLDGFDTLDGGTKNDKLTGGNDGDTLIGGKGHDRLFGEAGADNLVFDFKMTKHSAGKNFDRIGDFTTTEDTIFLKQTVFTALAPGDLPDTDTHVTLQNGNLLYDGIKFAKFLPGVAPASVDDIHFVVYA